MPPDEQTVLHLHRRQTDDGTPVDGVEIKSIGPLEIKDESKGLVRAVVATLNCVDRGRDVILSGAIPAGSTVKLSAYGHGIVLKNEPPVGLGTITEYGDKAIMDAQFFMNTHRGREAFETVKALGSHGEWSIGFRPVDARDPSPEWRTKGARRELHGIQLAECSPVFEGESLSTMTLTTKQADEERERLEAEAEAERIAAEEAEVKRLADEVALKEATARVMAEFERTQRTLRRMNVA